MGGASLGAAISVPITGGWQTYQTVSVKNLPLKAGQQVLRVTVGATDDINMNYISFTPSVSTGLESEALANVAFYPNPFRERLHIEMEGSFHYQLLSISGMLLEEGEGIDKIELASQHPKGIYLLKVSQDDKSRIVKLVKE